MRVFLVNCENLHEDGGVEYTTSSTVAVCSTRRKADALAARGGWSVEEVEVDQEFRDCWCCKIGFDGTEAFFTGPQPVLALPASGPDPWGTGCCWYGWTPEEARDGARKCYDRDIASVYKKLTAEIEERQRKLGDK